MVPGRGFSFPGWFRIAYCVDTAVIERSLAGFEAVARRFAVSAGSPRRASRLPERREPFPHQPAPRRQQKCDKEEPGRRQHDRRARSHIQVVAQVQADDAGSRAERRGEPPSSSAGGGSAGRRSRPA